MRSLLAFMLVLHYLLSGVLGGAWATAARAAAPSAAHPYVHSVLCQTHNYLRLDCFDHCNGEQSGQLLKKLIGGDDDPASSPESNKDKAQLDVHLLARPVFVLATPHYARAGSPTRLLPPAAAVPGIFIVEGPPPKV
ncbi:MAG: hypothetical protein H7330_12145 [Hymenobacteraceae bacterium]|nr:hypothetical protein [Hymenobacteraceae bacterium]